MSIFKDNKERPLTLSLYFFEVLEELFQELSVIEEIDDVVLTATIVSALTLSGTKKGPTSEDIAYVVERMHDYNSQKEKKEKELEEAETKTKKGSNKAFAEHAIEWIGHLPADKMCIWLADYDYELAEKFYCKYDRDTVTTMIDQKVENEWERMRVQFEASLFGFGGGYGESNDPNAEIIDLTEGGSTKALDKFFGRAG